MTKTPPPQTEQKIDEILDKLLNYKYAQYRNPTPQEAEHEPAIAGYMTEEGHKKAKAELQALLTASNRELAIAMETKYSKEELDEAIREARIKALTDVDNLNLLNDSDVWHKFYTAELKRLGES